MLTCGYTAPGSWHLKGSKIVLVYLDNISSNKQHLKWYFSKSECISYGDGHRLAPPGAAHQALGAGLGGGTLLPQTGCPGVTGEQPGFPGEILPRISPRKVIFPSWHSTLGKKSSVWHMLAHHPPQEWAVKVPFLIFRMDECSSFPKMKDVVRSYQ